MVKRRSKIDDAEIDNLKRAWDLQIYQKETLTQVLPCEFYDVLNNTFFMEHLWTATFETVTENSQGNSARGEKHLTGDEKLHII